MNLDKCGSIFARIFLAAAFVLLACAVLERLANLAGYTILTRTGYSGGRLLEFAVIALVFAIAILLRQILDELKKSRTS